MKYMNIIANVLLILKGSSSLSDKLIIDLSYCNKLVSIFESPVGSGNFQAKFEVILHTHIIFCNF